MYSTLEPVSMVVELEWYSKFMAPCKNIGVRVVRLCPLSKSLIRNLESISLKSLTFGFCFQYHCSSPKIRPLRQLGG